MILRQSCSEPDASKHEPGAKAFFPWTAFVAVTLLASLSPSTKAQQSNGQGPKMETEIVELTRHGFLPKEITRPAAGKHYLYIRDTTGLSGLSFQLSDDSHGGKAREDITPKPGQRRLMALMDLKPGHYRLTVTNHPEWTCDIVIGGN